MNISLNRFELKLADISLVKVETPQLFFVSSLRASPKSNWAQIYIEALATFGNTFQLPLAFYLPIGSSYFGFGLIEGNLIALSNVNDFFNQFSGLDFLSVIPSDFLNLSSLYISEFSLFFDIAKKTFHNFQFTITSKNEAAGKSGFLTLIPDILVLEDVSVTLSVSRYTKLDNTLGTAVAGQLTGVFEIANAIRVTASVTFDTGTGIWTVDAYSNLEIGLNAFNKYLGGDDIKGLLPGEIGRQIGDMSVTLRKIGFVINSKGSGIKGKIQQFSIDFYSSKDWIIIPGRLVLKNLIIDVGIFNTATSTVITGSVSGFLDIGKMEVEVQVGKYAADGDWLLDVKSRLIPLPSIGDIAGLLDDDLKAFLPQSLSSLEFLVHDLEIQLDLTTKTINNLSFTLEADTQWAIPLSTIGTPTSLRLSTFVYIQKVPTALTGSIRAVFSLPVADIELYADRISAEEWQFGGGNVGEKRIPIGDLIKNLTDLFSIPVQLPKAVQGLEIKTISVSFNTASKNFVFDLDMDFSVQGKTAELVLQLSLQNFNGTYQYDFSGSILIGGLEFDVKFSKNNTENIFLAGYENPGGSKLAIGDLLNDLTGEQLITNNDWTITIKDALFAYQGSAAGQQQSPPITKASGFILGVEMDTGIDLSALPLIGKLFTKDQTFSLVFSPVIASADFKETDLSAIRALAPAGTTVLPAAPAGSTDQTIIIKKGPNLAIFLRLGSQNIHLSLPVSFNSSSGQVTAPSATPGPGSAGTSNNLPAPAAPQQAGDGTQWFNIQKSFGPVSFKRLGVRYKDSRLAFLIDASLAVGPLSLSLIGLGVSSPLSPISPQFELTGIGIDYSSGPLEIAAAFLRRRVTPPQGNAYDEYDGIATLKAETFSLSAIGSYAYFNNHPSLFIYAVLDYPLGGPSFFFVKGLAAGFGYNRSLLMPAIGDVASFPLITQAMNASGGIPTTQSADALAARVTDELTKLSKYIPPTTGQYFLAVGIKFTSFELVNSFALLAISFGKHLEIDLLGISTAVIPTQEAGSSIPALAELQLAIKVVFLPEEGFLGVQAQLTQASYLLAPACHLTGGFAFFAWFKDQQDPSIPAGEFVLSLGGYHPNFTVPSYYPAVPRIGFSWQMSDKLSIKGGAYFALTPHVLMAGLQLEATYRDSSLQAWLKAGADFIIYWKPYHYDAEVHIEVKIDYTVSLAGSTDHISLDASADLHVWGPEFSGYGKIHVASLSFSIEFGSGSSGTPQPISWDEFKASFLPKNKKDPAKLDIYSARVKKGLLSIAQDDSASPPYWLINAKEMCIAFDSVIPLTAKPGSMNDAVSLPQMIGIAPMNTRELSSSVTIRIEVDGSGESNAFRITNPVLKNLPAGLWGSSLSSDLNGQKFVENALTGFEIVPAVPVNSDDTAPIKQSAFSFSTDGISKAYNWEKTAGFSADQSKGRTWIADTVMKPDIARQRSAILQAMEYEQADTLSGARPGFESIFMLAPQIGVFNLA